MTDRHRRPTTDPLSAFHPVVAKWFRRSLGEPTAVQAAAWPVIAEGRHALITAPTGSGKTLTAFLWALDRLLTGTWPGGGVRVLYISPLKALNNDIQRNLLGPLEALGAAFREAEEPAREVRVMTRSGDTTAAERRRMLKQPPEILITTPESLNILLTSKGGRSILGGVATVILDEVHAVAASKRGTHLITAVERLTLLSGEFQRLALSATVRPLDKVARFIGGFRIEPVAGGEPHYRARDVEVVAAPSDKKYELQVCSPVVGSEAARMDEPAWDQLAHEVRQTVRGNRSTLIFANSRRMTEKLTRLVNRDEADDVVYSHHGSLSREVRSVVEERLKAGRLAGIVATSSLELGIDIGTLDEVVMVQTPPAVSSALQRLGRAGHRVGDVSRGRIYPTFARDYIHAAVVARAVLDQEIEELRPIVAPLDVLAQVILSMTVAESWDIDDLYAFLRSCAPYHSLGRREYELVLEMLAGRYADSRVRELRPRLSLDRVDNTVRARPGTDRLVYIAGGTIPDRGYYQLRLEGSGGRGASGAGAGKGGHRGARLGELDEEFVWERSVGDTFTLGAQSWRIRSITHNDVMVVPSRSGAAMAPFWRADPGDRGFALSEKIGDFLAALDGRLDAGEARSTTVDWLTAEYAMQPTAAETLLDLVIAQRSATGCPLPHRRHLVVEVCRPSSEGDARRQIVLHTTWGGRVNRPLAIALAAAWEKRFGYALQVTHDDDCLILSPQEEVSIDDLLSLVSPDDLQGLLRERLEQTGFFGAHFRINCGCALLLPKTDFRHRQPLWLTRLKSKKLLETVARYADFPMVLETWRTCLEDELDLASLRQVLDELQRGEIRWTEVQTSQPSPFAADVLWRDTNRLMYADDTPEGGRGASLSAELLRELVFSSELRPRIPAAIVEQLRRKLHRVSPGYAPRSAAEMVEWVKERLLIPAGEWEELTQAAKRDRGEEVGADGGAAEAERQAALGEKLVRLDLPPVDPAPGNMPDTGRGAVVAIETIPRLAVALGVPVAELSCRGLAGESDPPATLAEFLARPQPAIAGPDDISGIGEQDEALSGLLGEWLRFYGPVSREFVEATWGVGGSRLQGALEELVERQQIVIDQVREDRAGTGPLEICDSENLERLLRMVRAAQRPTFEALPIERLPHFLATFQGVAQRGDGPEALQRALEQLFAFPAPVQAWESDILPARLDPYYPAWLDSLMQESGLLWVGCGRERSSFLFAEDLNLLSGNDSHWNGEKTAEDGLQVHSGKERGRERDGQVHTDTRGEGAQIAQDRSADLLEQLFPDPRAKVSFPDLVARSELESAQLAESLWRLAWAGSVSNTAFATVRQAAANRFKIAASQAAGDAVAPASRSTSRRGSFRRGFDRWRASRPWSGDWFRLGPAADGGGESSGVLDALDREEQVKDRVRLLLDRYGILFRELVSRELAAFGWARIFRSLRLMELSGEVLAGHFFAGVYGPQFATHAAFRQLREGLDDDAVYWLSAVDPAAPTGLGLEALQGRFPSRLRGNHLVFRGADLVVLSKRNGAELEFRVPPGHPRLLDYLGFLDNLLTRRFDPLRYVAVESINGEPAVDSAYAGRLAERFQATRDLKALRLRRRYDEVP